MKCGNPNCKNEVETPPSWKKQVKKYCSSKCRLEAWIIQKASKTLGESRAKVKEHLSKALEIIEEEV